jgi:hypothetical protein
LHAANVAINDVLSEDNAVASFLDMPAAQKKECAEELA